MTTLGDQWVWGCKNITLIDSNESNKELSLTEQVIKSIEMFYGKLNDEELVSIIPIVQDMISIAQKQTDVFNLLDVANYLYKNKSLTCQKVAKVLKNNSKIDEIEFEVVKKPNIEKEDITINDLIISNIEAICGKQSETIIEALNIQLMKYYISLAKNNKFDLIGFSNYLLNDTCEQIKEIGKTLLNYKNVLSNITFNIVCEDNVNCNFIPLGKNIETNQEIGWFLNNIIVPKDIYSTIPSTSFLLVDDDRLDSIRIIKKIIKFADQNCDKYQVVLSDHTKLTPKNIKEKYVVKGYTSSVDETLNMVSSIKGIITQRLKLMEEQNANNINDIDSNLNVNYYNIEDELFQFDDIIEMEYEDGYKEFITAEDLYNGINDGSIMSCDYSIEKTQGKFKPRKTLIIINNIEELIISADAKAVNNLKAELESIAKLGLTTNVYLFISAKYLSDISLTVNLLNKNKKKLILGNFNSDIFHYIFNKDVSNIVKFNNQNRGFLQSGNEIIEVQI